MARYTFSLLMFLSANLFSQSTYQDVRALNEINNSNHADAFPWISPDGLRLYYCSGGNSNQLVVSSRINSDSAFSTPVILSLFPAPIAQNQGVSYFLSNNELEVYMFLGDLWYAHRNTLQSTFSNPVKIKLSHPFSQIALNSLSLNNELNKLYLSAYDINLQQYVGLLEFNKIAADSFAYTRILPNPPGYIILGGQFSKDERSFIFSARHIDWRTSIYQLTRTNISDSFDLNTFHEIQGVNDTILANTQPTVADNLEWIIFVRSQDGAWTSNDLYIAKKLHVTHVINKKISDISIYPNPSTNIFHLTGIEQKILNLTVYNLQGQKIFQNSNFSNKDEVNLSDQPKGIYFMKIEENSNSTTEKIIVE
ncbi:MAG: serine/threonine kinase family protein [Bacteroidota bacterium]|nr:serine/threonine kinase family protein [Bacteroidota bacterium]